MQAINQVLLVLALMLSAMFIGMWALAQPALIVDGICRDKFQPQSDTTNYELYKHCIKYPETYGIKP